MRCHMFEYLPLFSQTTKKQINVCIVKLLLFVDCLA